MSRECNVGKVCRTCGEKSHTGEGMQKEGILQTLLADRAACASLCTSKRVPGVYESVGTYERTY